MKKILFCVIIGVLFIACQDNETLDMSGNEETVDTATGIDGMLTIKLQDDILRTIDNHKNDLEIPTGNNTLDNYLNSIGAYQIKRVFPYTGKYEDMQTEERLNAWYTVYYKGTLAKAKSAAPNNLFDSIEPVYEPVIEDYEISIPENNSLKMVKTPLFNDPFFARQWNLCNDGTIGTSISGADINIMSAWGEETGRPEVVVAIVDGGIDINHEDLVDNLWINTGEIPSNGIDDDNNGYIDDIYAFNFVNGTGTISPHDHGTHVAGVIAAKNNNGLGISSIAGGDGTANSGVAALIVSKYGDGNFTAAELKRRLLTGVKNLNANDYNTEKYKDKLGNGFLDASVALLAYDNSIVPDALLFADNQMKRDYAAITLAWKASSGAADGSIQSYTVYYSDREITASNYSDSDINSFRVAANYAAANEVLTRKITGLGSSKNYYFAIRAFARNGNGSDLVVYNGGISTLNNIPPAISANIDLSNSIQLAGNDIQEILFNIADAENHTWTYTLTYKEQLFIEQTANTLRVRIFANKFVVGSRNFELMVTDEYGASSSLTFNVKIVQDNPPRLSNDAGSLNVKMGSPKTISLATLVEDEDKASLKFTLGLLSNENAQVSLVNDQLTISPKKIGESELMITAADKHNQSTVITIPVFIYENEGIHALYPTLATQTVYLKLGDVIDGSIQLRIRNIVEKIALEKTYNTNEIDSQKRTLLVNVASLLPGKYELSITNNDKTYKESFVKK